MAALMSILESLKTGEFRAVKLGSKIVQVKGVMPQKGGLTRQTPTGRAVGQFVRYGITIPICKIRKGYAMFYILFTGCNQAEGEPADVMPFAIETGYRKSKEQRKEEGWPQWT